MPTTAPAPPARTTNDPPPNRSSAPYSRPATTPPPSSNPLAVPIAAAALGLGALGDALLRPSPWGIGAALWVAAAALSLLALAHRARVSHLAGPRALAVAPALLAAAALAWRDSPVLKTLDVLAVLLALAWLATATATATATTRPAAPDPNRPNADPLPDRHPRHPERAAPDPDQPDADALADGHPRRHHHAAAGDHTANPLPHRLRPDYSEVGDPTPSPLRLRRAGIADYALASFAAAWETAAGAVPLLTAEIGWRNLPRPRNPNDTSGTVPRRHAVAVGRGILLAAPALLLFGALLGAADPVFADLLRRALLPDLGPTVSHLAVTLAVAWPVAGYLRAVARNAPAPRWDTPPPTPLRLGAVEVGLLLGSLDALFLLFVVVQTRYLFGGAARVEASTTLTFAEYARRGFFELVAVAALALPLLLLVHWLLRRDLPAHRPPDRAATLFRILAGTQLLLLAVVLASALQRMRLYHDRYGLSELRLYTTAFMLWLALLLLWFALTVLRDRRPSFAPGALLAAALVLATLHALNPDALIVRANAARADAPNGRPFDAAYAASLSADAVPAILAAWPHLPPTDRCLLANRLRADYLDPDDGWRTQSLGRARARRAVRDHEADLRPCQPDRTDTSSTADDTQPGATADVAAPPFPPDRRR